MNVLLTSSVPSVRLINPPFSFKKARHFESQRSREPINFISNRLPPSQSRIMENRNQELKHLGFIKIAAINVLIWVSSLNVYVKENLGTMRSGFEMIENQVTQVSGPVLHKFKGVSFYLLAFLDKKADEAADRLNEYSPPLLKHLFFQTRSMVLESSELVRMIATEVQIGGFSAAVNLVASKYGPLVEKHTAKNWAALNRLPPFHMVAQIAVPTVAHWSIRYNQVVTGLGQKGYAVSSYLPLLPIERIAKAFRRAEERGNNTSAPSAGGEEATCEADKSD